MAVLCTDDAYALFAGLLEADDGTRTHDLLHGKCWRRFAAVRAPRSHPVFCRDFLFDWRTRANPSERRVLPLLPLCLVARAQARSPDSASFSATCSLYIVTLTSGTIWAHVSGRTPESSDARNPPKVVSVSDVAVLIDALHRIDERVCCRSDDRLPIGWTVARRQRPRRAHRVRTRGSRSHGRGALERRHLQETLPEPEDRRDAREAHPAQARNRGDDGLPPPGPRCAHIPARLKCDRSAGDNRLPGRRGVRNSVAGPDCRDRAYAKP
jgi:hypothetical protein